MEERGKSISSAPSRQPSRNAQRTFRLQQLHQRPDRDMLERPILALEEPHEVAMKTSLGLVPHSTERRVVVRCAREGRQLLLE